MPGQVGCDDGVLPCASGSITSRQFSNVPRHAVDQQQHRAAARLHVGDRSAMERQRRGGVAVHSRRRMPGESHVRCQRRRKRVNVRTALGPTPFCFQLADALTQALYLTRQVDQELTKLPGGLGPVDTGSAELRSDGLCSGLCPWLWARQRERLTGSPPLPRRVLPARVAVCSASCPRCPQPCAGTRTACGPAAGPSPSAESAISSLLDGPSPCSGSASSTVTRNLRTASIAPRRTVLELLKNVVGQLGGSLNCAVLIALRLGHGGFASSCSSLCRRHALGLRVRHQLHHFRDPGVVSSSRLAGSAIATGTPAVVGCEARPARWPGNPQKIRRQSRQTTYL